MAVGCGQWGLHSHVNKYNEDLEENGAKILFCCYQFLTCKLRKTHLSFSQVKGISCLLTIS